MSCPRFPHQIISSISSTEFRKAIFLVWRVEGWWTFAQQMEAWAPIDEALCGVVDRLNAAGCHHTLEAEVRFAAIRGDHRDCCDFTKLLPKFREKGTVTIRDLSSGGDRLLHSSVHNR